MSKETVGKCRICHKEITHDMLGIVAMDHPEKAVYHESFGVACAKHAGVKDHFAQLVYFANEKLAQVEQE